jgi:hypothetical protein
MVKRKAQQGIPAADINRLNDRPAVCLYPAEQEDLIYTRIANRRRRLSGDPDARGIAEPQFATNEQKEAK